MAKYKAYPEYKDSGVEWLGKIPIHWIRSKFGYLKTILTDYTANGSFADLKSNVTYLDEPSYARLVRLTDLRHDLNNSNGVWIDKNSYNYLGKSSLYGGEFLLANVGAYAGLFYQMPYNKGPASLAPNMFMAKFSPEKISRKFIAYVGQADNISKQLMLKATASSAQPKLNKDDFKSIFCCYPPLNEQKKISVFLDHETTKIDNLIEKQQQLIELLKEKRQAVISHAVTKGLNPDVPMKDSGVEWLGEIPEHWLCTKIKYIALLTPKKSSVNFKNNDECTFIPMEKLKRNSLVTDESKLIRDVISGYTYFEDDDLLLAKVTPCFENKNIAVARGLVNNIGFGSTEIYVLRPTEKIRVDYLLYRLQEDNFIRAATGAMTGAGGLKRVPSDFLLNYPIAIPPKPEMDAIVAYLNAQEVHYDLMEKNATQAVQLLQERRTALISAAVTGKIDVRDWIAPDTQDVEEPQEATA
ncbi:restriction endonuclease subunit S [Cronobacter malonaticus]|uniref:restriction endonuclease subunit S n=1 Tax=Cronobacter malonaticus TaxID=413503 RepID=UPI002DB6A48A|nr:restriction endonuclease subunit S [Cronobacter malonaticus]MEB8478238.1 restriction endonuclease subunit S [Cronobacter malonaticus]